MVSYLEAALFHNIRFQIIQHILGKLDYLLAICANHVMMLMGVGLRQIQLITRKTITEINLLQDAYLLAAQKLQCPVHSSQAYISRLLLQNIMHFLGTEMYAGIVHKNLQHNPPLVGTLIWAVLQLLPQIIQRICS